MSSLQITYADLRKLMSAMKDYKNDDRLMKEKLNELDDKIKQRKFDHPPSLFISQSVSNFKVSDYECDYNENYSDGNICMKMKRSKFEALKQKHSSFT